MLSLEEYIARRKKEDRLNEFNVDARSDNMRICVNYIFEYFNNYLTISEVDEKTALHDEKMDKYRQQMRDYDPDIQEWLVRAYSDHGKHLNRQIAGCLTQYEFFFLYDSDSEFRSASYECYSQLIKKLPMLKDQTEMLFRFIKDYHRVKSQPSDFERPPDISDGFDEWIQKTWALYQVNLCKFAIDWVEYFCNHEDIWPRTHRLKSQNSWQKYEYDHKQKSNLFNIDSMYRQMPKKPFTRGRKQEFETLMMYFWLHRIVGDDEHYWEEYLGKCLRALEKA